MQKIILSLCLILIIFLPSRNEKEDLAKSSKANSKIKCKFKNKS